MVSISFDQIAERYDATRGFPPGVPAQVAEALAREVGLVPAMHMLEIGVGTGRIAVPVATHVSGLHYVGVDISSEMMQRLRGKLPPTTTINLLQADATRLPFADCSFDVALEVHVLHLVSSVEETIAELWRVLRPGGLFLSGYNHYEEDSDYAELRYRRWEGYVTELGGSTSSRNSVGSEIDGMLEPIFGQPHTVTLTEWQEQISPRILLDLLARRTWSGTWNIPEPIFAESVRRTEAWAHEYFSDLDRPIERKGSFRLEVYER